MKPQFAQESVRELQEFLASRPRRIVITTHFKPDGDALGSSLGLSAVLKRAGHEVRTVSPSEFPAFLSWMEDSASVVDFLQKREEAKKLFSAAELVFCLDFNDPGRVEGMSEILVASPAKKILVDHHLDPKPFCDLTFSEPRVSSTSELVMYLLEAIGLKDLIDRSAAEAFYAGIMTDTGSFRFNSVSPDTHLSVAFLLSKGARNDFVHEQIYDTNSEWRLRYLGHALLNRMTILPDYHTVYFTATKEEMDAFHHQPGDTEGLVNYGLSIAGIKMAALFSERDRLIKISFRSKGEFSVKNLAEKYFEGGGHKNAAGGRSAESLDATIARFKKILELFRNELK
jgi:bifunctional oligoribonuclease and PAP phosphatase NrnA